MNRKKIIIISAVIIILAVVLLLYFFVFQKSDIKKDQGAINAVNKVDVLSNQEQACANLPDDQKNLCLDKIASEKAVESHDAQKCLGIKSVFIEHNCVLKVALAGDKVELCSVLDGQKRTDCENYFYLNTAFKKQDKALCEKISSPDVLQGCLAELGGQ